MNELVVWQLTSMSLWSWCPMSWLTSEKCWKNCAIKNWNANQFFVSLWISAIPGEPKSSSIVRHISRRASDSKWLFLVVLCVVVPQVIIVTVVFACQCYFNRVISLVCLERVISLVVSINRVWSPDRQRTKSLCNILTVKKIDIRRKCVHKFPFWDLRWTFIAHRNRRLPTANHVHLHIEWCPVCKQNQFIFLHFVQFIRCPCCYCWYSTRSGRWWVFPFTPVDCARCKSLHHTIRWMGEWRMCRD